MEQFASESSSCLACAMAGRSGCREKGAPEFRCTPKLTRMTHTPLVPRRIRAGGGDRVAAGRQRG